MVRPVTYSYTVNFMGVDTTQRPAQITSGQLTEIGDTTQHPAARALYAQTVVPIRADSLPWDRYLSVQVEVRYDDAANQVHEQMSWVLTEKTGDINWALFLIDPTQRTFSYRLTYTLGLGRNLDTPGPRATRARSTSAIPSRPRAA